MKKYKFKGLLLVTGWLEDVSVTVDSKGLIAAIDHNHTDSESTAGYAVPGFQNTHSHAFQYAMAGLAEIHNEDHSSDDFWGWRELMYQIALTLTPDDLEAVAAMLYAEMLKHGYTHVAEFHYLHHDKDGNPYANLAEHGERLMAAAQQAGIKITLLPILYQKGGFGQEPNKRQRRFISKSIDDYYKLLEASEKAVSRYDGASIGHGIHSIRAVSAENIISVTNNLELKGPFHMHVAEQVKEVEDCLAYYGRRPVEWLLENTHLNANTHLVHATHLTDDETSGIATSGAHVVLCPSTEGNLGDGIFPLRNYQESNGKWSIGTDSHVGLNPCEELRLLDYGQRLTTHKRNTFISKHFFQSGDYAFNKALLSGRAAMGNEQQAYFEVGQPFDAVVYDAQAPLLNMTTLSNLLSTIIYSADPTWIKGTIINGEWLVKDQRHTQATTIGNRFSTAIKRLQIR